MPQSCNVRATSSFSLRHARWGVLLGSMSVVGLVGCSDPDPLPDDEPACTEAGQICTFMGDGKAALGTDGVAPKDVSLYLPQDMVWGPDGTPYVLDWNNHRVRAVIDGMVQTVIGTGELGDAPAGPALETRLNHPTHVAFAPDGDLILSAWHNSKLMRMDRETGELELICGDGQRSFAGEGVPATEAVLDLPVATVVDDEGRILVMDQGNQRIRLIDTDGVITTLVGPVGLYVPEGYEEICSDVDPEPGQARACKFCEEGATDFDTCEGPPARPQGFAPGQDDGTLALMNQPFTQSAPPSGGMEAMPDGRVAFADTGNQLIRVLELDGGVTTLAGVEPEPYGPEELATKAPAGDFAGQDGSSALEARFNNPRDVSVAADGTVFVADTFNSCVRKITPGGEIFTVAGICGEPGDTGDGGEATLALLDRPYGVALDYEGNLYIADTHNHRIRMVLGAAVSSDE